VNKVLQRPDVSLSAGARIVFTLRHFKTSKDNRPVIISLQANPSSLCPVAAMQLYFQHFRHSAGPLFQSLSGQPITYSFVTEQLRSAAQFAGLNPAVYKGHSFRMLPLKLLT